MLGEKELLREYALTPQIFESGDKNNVHRSQEWYDELRNFLNNLLYDIDEKTLRSGIIISDYCGGNFGVVLADIRRTAEMKKSDMKENDRHTFIRLIKKLEKLCVYRPSYYDPTNEDSWIKQAQKTAKEFPIDRIVSTISQPKSNDNQEVFGLYELQKRRGQFWILPDKDIRLSQNIKKQVEALEKFLQFSSAISFICPYFALGVSGQDEVSLAPEGNFPIELLKKKIQSCNDFVQLKSFSLITCAEKIAKTYEEIARRCTTTIANSVPKSDSFDINVYVLPKEFKQRRVLFGKKENDDFKSQWGISMDHYVIKDDKTSKKFEKLDEKHKFSLMQGTELTETRDKYFPSDLKPDWSSKWGK